MHNDLYSFRGKTKRCLEIAAYLKSKNEKVGGIVAPGFWENNTRSGFDLMDIQTGKTRAFAQRTKREEWRQIKTFYFNPQAISWGDAVLRKAHNQCDWIFLDELGKLDMQGHLWNKVFTELIQHTQKNWILSIRESFVEEVIQQWRLYPNTPIHLHDTFPF